MSAMVSVWRPSATLSTLQARARMLDRLRGFFAGRGILEVETPAIVAWPVSEPQLANISCQLAIRPGRPCFLRTSPEYHLKRLLAAGSGDVYEICKVFRDAECGPRHLPEFTMIEWYRRGLSLEQIIAETCELISAVAGTVGCSVPSPHTMEYAQMFLDCVGIDPLEATTAAIAQRTQDLLGDRVGASLIARLGGDREACLDLLMAECIEPMLRTAGLVVIQRYPAAQASLARLDPRDPRRAERFEVFFGGLELANGYRELTDPAEQRRRLGADNAIRRRRGVPEVSGDPLYLAALDAGLPDCCGVALGFDRLVMAALGLSDIREAVSFPVPDPD